MKSKNRLNCYVFSNLMISFIAINFIAIRPTTELVSKTSDVVLEKIYEPVVVETVSVPDVIISEEPVDTPVVHISNNTNNSKKEEKREYVKPSYNSLTGANVVNYAKQFLGLKYVYAGNSLATGTDCSGFTRLIFKEFGISLGRTVSSQLSSGTYVSKEDLRPGDIVFYSYGSTPSHVAIYMGDGLIIHESTPKYGVKISSVNIMRYITARRLITANVVSKSNEVVSESNNLVIEKNTEENKVIENVEEKIENTELDVSAPIIENSNETDSQSVDSTSENNKQPEENNVQVEEVQDDNNEITVDSVEKTE